jgi:hypothetical protein
MLKRSDDRASVAERRNVCARRSGAADGLLFSLFVWLGAIDRSWADYSPIYCTAGVDPLLAAMKGSNAEARYPNWGQLNLRVLYESQIEGCKHQDNADVHYQPFPESIPKEEQIHTNYNGYQHPNVKPDKHTLCHFNLLSTPTRQRAI